MIKARSHLLALTLLLGSGQLLAQTVPSDKELIDKYCKTIVGIPGEFVNKNGVTTLKCISDSPRYFFEKMNAKIGLQNSDGAIKGAYLTHPLKWREMVSDFILDQSQNSKLPCQSYSYKGDDLTLRCGGIDKALNTAQTKSLLDSVSAFYKAGAVAYKKDADQNNLALYLAAKDTNSASQPSRIKLSAHKFKNYYLGKDEANKLPGFNDYLDKGYKLPSDLSPYFWSTAPKINIKEFKRNIFLDYNSLSPVLPIIPLKTPSFGGKYATTFTLIPTNEVSPPVVVPDSTEATVPAEVVTQTTIKENITHETTPEKCQDELTKALSKLLEDDKKNIIGQQFELTVMKVAAIALSERSTSLEGLIKKQSQQIAKMDKGIIEKMNKTYKDHGLSPDMAKISNHLKQKSAKANYFFTDKRFFNEESSAFILAYQKMHDSSGIKDTDISVLWFMDQVTKKAQQGKSGKYSSQANLTNLSTRVARYTGLTGGAKPLTKPELTEMAQGQQKKLETEYSEFVEKFKEENSACYKELFNEGSNECDLSVVEASLSQLLAVQSKISSTELVSIDEELKGGIDKSRFQISRFAD